jgi:CRP-like cAMP-binding protein
MKYKIFYYKQNDGLGNLTEIKVLKTGESFGELALISKKHRMASILCKEECSFAVLEKKYFYEILRKFFHNLKFFSLEQNLFYF